MKIFWIVASLIFFAVMPVAAQHTESPYIYYWGRYGDESAIIIERADGTDPHVLAIGGFPLPAIVDTSWSPSGEWFAYTMTSSRDGDPFVYSDQRLPVVINIDGIRRVSVLDNFVSAYLSWSPTDDLLFVMGLPKHDGEIPFSDTAIYQLALVDPEQDAILASVQIPLVVFPEVYSIQSYYRMQWTADGHYLIFHYQDASLDVPEHPAIFQIFDTQENTVTTVLNLFSPFSPFVGSQALAILPDAIAVFAQDDQLVFSGIPNGWPYLDTVDLSTGITSIVPHESEPIVLLLLDDSSLWWLDLREQQIVFEKVADNVLPNEVNYAFNDTSDSQFWSPDGQSVVFAVQDEGLYRLTIADGSTDLLLADPSAWRWREDGLLEVASIGTDEVAYLYLLLDTEGNIIAQVESLAGENGFSSSGMYVGGVGSSPYVQNVSSGEFIQLSPNGYVAPQSDHLGSLEWHPSVDWAISQEISFVPMMGPDPSLYSVFNADASVRRDIAACFQFCVDWLPDRVDVSKIPPADSTLLIPAPMQVYLVDDYVTYLIWSPDSQSLLLGSGGVEPHTYQWLHLDTRILEAVAAPELCGFCRAEWEQDETHGYRPTLTEPIFTLEQGYGSWETSINPNGLEASVTFDDLSFAAPIELRDTTAASSEVQSFVPGWAVAFSPNGQYLAISAGWEVRLYRTEDIMAWMEKG